MRFTPATFTFFLFLIIGGHVLLPVLVAASIISRDVHRNPILISWIFAWMVYSVSMCLLLYSGENLLYSQPPRTLCLAQAAVNYSSVVLCTFGALMFVVNLWLSIRSIALEKAPCYANNRIWRCFAIIFPCAIFLIVLLLVLLVGSAHPTEVFREYASFFCSVDLPIIRGVQGFAAMALFAMLVFEVWIAVLLGQMHKRKVYLRKSGGPASYHLCIRVAFFTVYILLAIAATVCIWTRPTRGPFESFTDIILSTVPLAVFLCFGTQRDLVRAYVCGILWVWKRIFNRKRY
ncbi:hypothetical protein SCHPADRAFT_991761 [Schizopora paradoxa]|uniref:G-protein coupled receptors family 1 profile domain-containing protein n=1 Tax=Schizopora paradoxa TaxID=27342 RepID=A0A0H2SF51_9AGAM|nr:hypothetical protein SCHPADRAFT_991761 [Schizopora paradoxa]